MASTKRLLNRSAPAGPARCRRRLVAFALEPRLLYSADLGLGAGLVVDAAQPGNTGPTMTVGDVPADSGSRHLRSDPQSDPRSDPRDAGATPAPTAGREILVIDPAVPDADRLAGALVDARPEVDWQVVRLDPTRDGLVQLTQWLDPVGDSRPVAALHLLGHGSDGEMRLGDLALGFETLAARATEVMSWRSALAGADLVLYGCDVAGTADGRSLVDALGRLTGAQVLASTDATGSADHLADWHFEYVSGETDATDAARARGLALTGALEVAAMAAGWSGRLAPGEVTVSTTDDVVDVDTVALASRGAAAVDWLALNPGTDGRVSLREAVLAANVDADRNTIWLPAGTHALTRIGTDDTALLGDLDLNHAVEIRGLGAGETAVVDGQASHRLFDIGAVDVVLSNLTLQNGDDGVGGAVSADGATLAIDSVVFSGNRATGSGARGGAIDAAGGTLTIAASRFQSNEATGLADRGGAVSTDGTTVSVTGSVFDSNDVSGIFASGGAIAALNGALAIDDSVFTGNTGTGSGGAISIVSAQSVVIEDSRFEGNKAWSGGGLNVQHLGAVPVSVAIDRTHFVDNEATGILGNGGGLRVVGSGQGGAVPLALRIDSALFEGNLAQNGAGGAIELSTNAASSAEVVNSTFTANEAGGFAVLATTSTIRFDHVTLAGNDAASIGGVIGAYGGTPAIRLANTLVYETNPNQGATAIVSDGFNAENANRLGLTGAGDRVDLGVTLSPLPLADNNGDGLAESMALDSTNPARDGADPASGVTVDQRGAPRSATDPSVGAFEVTDAVVLSPVTDVVAFIDNVTPVALFPDLLVRSDDPNRKIDESRIEITSGAQPGDTLSAEPTPSLTPSAPGTVVTLSGDRQMDKHEAGLRTVRFSNSLASPAPGDRTITLRVTDEDGIVTTITRTVTVAATVDEPPAITSDGGGASATIRVQEDDAPGTPFATVAWSDPDTSTPASVSLQGADAALFTIDASNRIAFATVPDYESAAAIADGRSWTFSVVVDSGGLTDTQTLTIVLDDRAPQVAAPTDLPVSQGQAVSFATAQLNATDGGTAPSAIRFRIDLAPTEGILRIDGAAAGVGSEFTQQDVLDGRISYVHGGGSVPADSVTFSVGTRDADGVDAPERAVDVTVRLPMSTPPAFEVLGPPAVPRGRRCGGAFDRHGRDHGDHRDVRAVRVAGARCRSGTGTRHR